jgi:hypothetical protein
MGTQRLLGFLCLILGIRIPYMLEFGLSCMVMKDYFEM